MIPTSPRPIRADEAEVVRRSLAAVPVGDVPAALATSVGGLEVVARCECGCASVDFRAPASELRTALLADGLAQTPRGGVVGVIVWGRPDAITGLEVYDLGAGGDDLGLPVPGSIRPFEADAGG